MHRFWIGVVVTSLGLPLAAGAQERESGSTFRKLVGAGAAAVDDGRAHDAMRDLEAALQLRPEDTYTRGLLSVAYYLNGSQQRANREGERVLRATASAHERALMLVNIAMRLPDRAEEPKLREAIKVDPTTAAPYQILAELYDGTGRPEEALDLERQALVFEPDPGHNSERYFDNESYPVYLDALAAEARGEPQAQVIARWQKLHTFECGYEDSAASSLERRAREHLDRLGVHVEACTVADRWKSTVDAQEDESASTNVTKLIDAGFRKSATRDEEGALALFRRASAQVSMAHVYAADSLIALKRFDEAVQEATRAVEELDEEATAHVALARCLRHAGRLDEALAAANRALQRDPSSAAAWAELSAVENKRSALTQALAAGEKALELALSPSFRMAVQVNLADVELMQGALDRAEARLNQALELAPGEADPYYSLAYLYELTGRSEAAATLERQAVDLDPAGETYRHMSFDWRDVELAWDGLVAEARGDREGAVSAWTELARLDAAGKLHQPRLQGRADAHLRALALTVPGVLPPVPPTLRPVPAPAGDDVARPSEEEER